MKEFYEYPLSAIFIDPRINEHNVLVVVISSDCTGGVGVDAGTDLGRWLIANRNRDDVFVRLTIEPVE
jgi:hypothetical protein